MQAKIQKTFLLTIGSNDDRVTEEALINKALAIETRCNTTSPNLRIHIEEFIGIPEKDTKGEAFLNDAGNEKTD